MSVCAHRNSDFDCARKIRLRIERISATGVKITAIRGLIAEVIFSPSKRDSTKIVMNENEVGMRRDALKTVKRRLVRVNASTPPATASKSNVM
jgi:hypothetical protein